MQVLVSLSLLFLCTFGDWQMPPAQIYANLGFETKRIDTKVQNVSMASQILARTQSYYSEVFERVHASLERWHVIRTQHILDAIDVVAQEGPAMRSYLIQLAKKDRSIHGWPYWALLCGSLAKIGGNDATAILTELAEDANAPLHVREWANRALEGRITSPDER